MLKSIFQKIIEVFDSVNRARAASHFTRMGRPDLAKRIMLED